MRLKSGHHGYHSTRHLNLYMTIRFFHAIAPISALATQRGAVIDHRRSEEISFCFGSISRRRLYYAGLTSPSSSSFPSAHTADIRNILLLWMLPTNFVWEWVRLCGPTASPPALPRLAWVRSREDLLAPGHTRAMPGTPSTGRDISFLPLAGSPVSFPPLSKQCFVT